MEGTLTSVLNVHWPETLQDYITAMQIYCNMLLFTKQIQKPFHYLFEERYMFV